MAIHPSTSVLRVATSCVRACLQSYITFGEPNLKSVRELVYKRGFAKVLTHTHTIHTPTHTHTHTARASQVNKQRLPLTDNKLVEDSLGSFGIVCVEVWPPTDRPTPLPTLPVCLCVCSFVRSRDAAVASQDLIHEIFTVGPNFKHASSFLWPFKLSSPTGGYKQKVLFVCLCVPINWPWFRNFRVAALITLARCQPYPTAVTLYVPSAKYHPYDRRPARAPTESWLPMSKYASEFCSCPMDGVLACAVVGGGYTDMDFFLVLSPFLGDLVHRGRRLRQPRGED
jgi:hypothetical protein